MDDGDDDFGTTSHGSGTAGQDEDLSLPKGTLSTCPDSKLPGELTAAALATLNKLMQESLPKGLLMTKELKELIGECCLEFVHLLSSEANELCEKESKKTINGEHILKALESLGFSQYMDVVGASVEEHSKSLKDRERKTFRLENSGLTPEELLRNQEELFARARQRLQSSQATETQVPSPKTQEQPLPSSISTTAESASSHPSESALTSSAVLVAPTLPSVDTLPPSIPTLPLSHPNIPTLPTSLSSRVMTKKKAADDDDFDDDFDDDDDNDD